MEQVNQSLKAQLREQLTTLKSIKGKRDGRVSIKAAGDMINTNVTGSGYSFVGPEGMGYIPLSANHNSSILDYFPKVQVNSHSIILADEIDADGSIDFIQQGVVKPEVDSDVYVTNPQALKTAGYVKVSAEMLDDIDFMSNLIQTKLMRETKNSIALDFIQAILIATPNLLDTNLTAGTTGTLLADIIPAVTEDMQIQKGYTPNLWLLNAPNYAKLFAENKSNLVWYALNEPVIKACGEVDAANIVGLDTSMFPLYVYKDIMVEIGQEGNDFKYNMVTIRGEARVSWNIRGNCLDAIYNDSIADTLAAIA